MKKLNNGTVLLSVTLWLWLLLSGDAARLFTPPSAETPMARHEKPEGNLLSAPAPDDGNTASLVACVEPGNINPGFNCPTVFNPVCGCDGQTYTNDCVAANQNGLTGYLSGVCADILDAYAEPLPCNTSGNPPFFGNTNINSLNLLSTYSCNPNWLMTGPEDIYSFSTISGGNFYCYVGTPNIPRLDIFLVRAGADGSLECIDYADQVINTNIAPGAYYLIVDGRDGASGSYTLQTQCPSGGAPSSCPTNPDEIMCLAWVQGLLQNQTASDCEFPNYNKIETGNLNNTSVVIFHLDDGLGGSGTDIYDCQGNLIQSCFAGFGGSSCQPPFSGNLYFQASGLSSIWECNQPLPDCGGSGSGDCTCTTYTGNICDNFDSYTAGQDLGPQSPCWTTWTGIVGDDNDGLVSTTQATSGSNALRIQSGDDVVLQLGNRSSGHYLLSYNLYVPDGRAAYQNLLHVFTPNGSGNQWACELFFYTGGSFELNAGGNNAASGTYLQNYWTSILYDIDIDGNQATLWIDGQEVHSWPFDYRANSPNGGIGQLAALNLYGDNALYDFYVDDVRVVDVNNLPDCPLDADDVLCLDWINNEIDNAVNCCTDDFCDLSVQTASWNGQPVVIISELIISDDVTSIYDCEGNLLQSYASGFIGSYANPDPPIVGLADLNNQITVWECGQEAPDCNSNCIDPSIITGNYCPTVYIPVCGCDGNTYSNDCFAREAGVTSWIPGECNSGNTQCSATTLISCNGTINDGSGNNNYASDLDCSWLIAPPGATSVTLTFYTFDTESNYDFVRVYDGFNSSAPLLGAYSGSTLPPVLTAFSGSMYIEFTTDGSVTRAGWSGSFSCEEGDVIDCIIPVNPQTVDVGHTYVSISWDNTANYGQAGYEARWREVGTTTWQTSQRYEYCGGGSCPGCVVILVYIPPSPYVFLNQLKPCTQYEVQIREFDLWNTNGCVSGYSESHFISTTACDNEYLTTSCYSVPASGSCTGMECFSFANINSCPSTLECSYCTCTNGDNGYEYYASLTANVTAGGNYPLSLDFIEATNVQSDPQDIYCRAWIDFNQDLDFDDPGEQVLEQFQAGAGNLNGNIAIPLNASAGQTRMRVSFAVDDHISLPSCDDVSYPGPCELFAGGMVMDLNVNITPFDLPPCPSASEDILCSDWLQAEIDFNNIDNCSDGDPNTTFTVDIEGFNGGQVVVLQTYVSAGFGSSGIRQIYDCAGNYLGSCGVNDIIGDCTEPYLIPLDGFSPQGIWDCSQTVPECGNNPFSPEIVFVEGGSFTMGCTAEQMPDCDGNESPTHEVFLNDFWIGKYELTRKEWKEIFTVDPSGGNTTCDNCPVNQVTWWDAVVYCNRLSFELGFEPCYYSDSGHSTVFDGTPPITSGTVYWKRDADGVRLPTEAEWEYAARGGQNSQGYVYAGSNDIDEVGWHSGISGGVVGTKAPNELGTYDMSGKMNEWCWDYSSYYSNEVQINPTGPPVGNSRVTRGGSYQYHPSRLRVANREFFSPTSEFINTGFRIAKGPIYEYEISPCLIVPEDILCLNWIQDIINQTISDSNSPQCSNTFNASLSLGNFQGQNIIIFEKICGESPGLIGGCQTIYDCSGEVIIESCGFPGPVISTQHEYILNNTSGITVYWDESMGAPDCGPPSSCFRIAVETTDASCPDGMNGSIQATVIGGTPPYTYQWSTGATTAALTRLAPGNYQLTVVDADGCSESSVVVLGEYEGGALALPDGSGVEYETSIQISGFPAEATLANVDDLLAICINIEHSWMHDLEIFLTCPNGNQVQLQRQENISNEVHLGEPNESDDSNTPSPPAQGVGYEYCWTPSSTNGTWTEHALANDPGDTMEYTLPTGNYESYEPLEGLVGCSLNGEWTLTVWDIWAADNGWIFDWDIKFALGDAAQEIVVGGEDCPSPWPTISCDDNPNFHLIQVPDDISSNFAGQPLQPGDWLGVYCEGDNGQPIFMASAEWDGGPLLLTVCADDPATPEKDGFSDGEEFGWKVQRNGTEYNATATYYAIGEVSQTPLLPDAEGAFAGNVRISRVKSLDRQIIIIGGSCEEPAEIFCGETYAGNNSGGTEEFFKYNCSDYYYDGREIVHLFRHQSDGDVVIQLSGLSADLDLILLSTCDRNYCERISVRSGTQDEAIFAPDLPAGDYFVVVDGYAGNITDYTLSVSCEDVPNGPLNCSQAQVIECNTSVDGNLQGASQVAQYGCGTGSYESGPEDIYKFRLSGSSRVRIRLTPTEGQDLDLFVLSDCSNSGDCITASELGGAEIETAEFRCGALSPNRDYYIVVEGHNGATGMYQLQLDCSDCIPCPDPADCPPETDLDCTAATPLECAVPLIGQTNAGGQGNEENYPSCLGTNTGPEVVFVFNNEVEQSIVIELYDMQENLNLYVLNACNHSDCRSYGGFRTNTEEERIVLEALPPGEYFIVVDGYNNAISTFSLLVTCLSTTLDCQDIQLLEGRNYISSYIKPQNADIQAVFESHKEQLGIGSGVVRDENGQTLFFPPSNGIPMNDIGDWDNTKGYLVTTASDFNLRVCGTRVPEDMPISFWDFGEVRRPNIVGYLKETPEAVDAHFNGNLDIRLIRRIDDAEPQPVVDYTPSFGANDFMMNPGRAFLLYGYTDGQMDYTRLAGAEADGPVTENEFLYTDQSCTYFRAPNTGMINHAYLYVPPSAQQGIIEAGDELGIFDPRGKLVCGVRLDGAQKFVSITGEEPGVGSIIPGIRAGEEMTIKLWKSATNELWDVEPAFSQGSATFEPLRTYILEGLEVLTTASSHELGFESRLYPNPATKHAWLEWWSPKPGSADIELLSVNGQLLRRWKVESTSGFNALDLNLNKVDPGLYLVRLRVGMEWSMHKLSLIR